MKAKLKVGDVVRFHTPNADENPNQKFKLVELIDDVADIESLDTIFFFPPIYRVKVQDLELVK